MMLPLSAEFCSAKADVHFQAPGRAVIFERVTLPAERIVSNIAEGPANRPPRAAAELDDVIALASALELDAISRRGIGPGGAPEIGFGVVDSERGAVPVERALLR